MVDTTPPRLKLIATIAAISVVTLVSLHFVLTSYYAMMTDEARREKLAPTTELEAHRKAEQDALSGARIDQAMSALAKGARAAAITPEPSDDLGPMIGWTKLPKPAPTPAPRAALAPAMEAVAADAGPRSIDAGASMSSHPHTH